jgi:hypothetical protein
MTNKKTLPLAVGAALTATLANAQTAYINDQGLGEIHVLPFYSAENGNATNVAIANTTAMGKAVKVRIIEGQNSKEVLDFNLYMSPEDHFSFAIVATADGGGSLVTNDASCTVPRLTSGEAVPFRNTLYMTDKAADDPETDKDESYDNTSVTRTAVGYVEIIEMGQLDGAVADWDQDADTKASISPMLAAITHGADGIPANCDLPVAAWSTAADGTDGAWLADVIADEVADTFMSPSWVGGGLYAYAAVVNAADAAAIGIESDAIDDAVEADSDRGGYALHYEPGDTRPDFTDEYLVEKSTIAIDGANANYDFSLTAYPETDMVSSLFMKSTVYNDYVTDEAILGDTDWVLTFPTKTFHISRAVVAEREPFTVAWDGKKACEYAAVDAWDREEQQIAPPDQSGDPDFSPAPPPDIIETYDLPLCYEVTVVQFGDESAVVTDSLAVDGSPYLPGVDGWVAMSMEKAPLTADSKTVITNSRTLDDISGLPVTGFAVQTYGNDNLNGSGAVGNYAMAIEHKSSTVSSSSD